MAAKNELGRHGEQLAATYLQAEGMTIIERNWRCRDGEIDIIAEDGPSLVVVEVKTRSEPLPRHGAGVRATRQMARLRVPGRPWLADQPRVFAGVRHRRDRARTLRRVTSPCATCGGRARWPSHAPAASRWSASPAARSRSRPTWATAWPVIHLIGLPDTALSEARERVSSAVVNSRYPWPDARITVSLFPASLPKRGSQFDLAIAVAILGAAGVVPAEASPSRSSWVSWASTAP